MPKIDARAAETREIIGLIVDWAGGRRQALAWYRGQPIPAFGSRTAETVVGEGRAGLVRDYIHAIANGGFA